LKDEQAFEDIVASKNVGDRLVVDYKNRTGAHQTTITLAENPYLEIVTFEKAGQTLTTEQQDFRNKWLSSKVK